MFHSIFWDLGFGDNVVNGELLIFSGFVGFCFFGWLVSYWKYKYWNFSNDFGDFFFGGSFTFWSCWSAQQLKYWDIFFYFFLFSVPFQCSCGFVVSKLETRFILREKIFCSEMLSLVMWHNYIMITLFCNQNYKFDLL